MTTPPSPHALLLSILVTAGCAGGTPTAESPTPPPETSTTAPAAAAATSAVPVEPAPAATSEAKAPAATETAAPASPAPKADTPPTPPHELLTAEGVAFELDWQASTAHLIVDQKCRDRVGEEPDALAKCVEGERTKFAADILRFRKVGGQVRWTVYKRDQNRLQIVYSVPFVFVDETDYSVSLLLQGKGNGYPPVMAQMSTVPLNLPSVYAIELNDPVWGSLVYNSKRGLVTD